MGRARVTCSIEWKRRAICPQYLVKVRGRVRHWGLGYGTWVRVSLALTPCPSAVPAHDAARAVVLSAGGVHAVGGGARLGFG